MSDLEQIFSNLYRKMSGHQRDPRPPIYIPPENVDPPVAAPPSQPDEIKRQQDYIVIRVNQLFLVNDRQWFTQIEPMVFASTEFLYDGSMRTDPYIVGPKKDEGLPRGTVMRNIIVFGPQPYRGGALTYTIVLSQLPVGDVAKQLLDVVESTSSVLAPSLGLSTYTKMGSVVVDGFERLMGLNAVKPLMAVRQTLSTDASDTIKPGYFALIDLPNLNAAEFWVADNLLLHGPTRQTAKPFEAANFVLCQLIRVPGGKRGDTDRLPFFPLWKTALEAATKPASGAWEEAKANLAVLSSAITLSPDLTFAQGQEMIDDYVRQLKVVHARTGQNALAAADGVRHEARLAKIADILALE